MRHLSCVIVATALSAALANGCRASSFDVVGSSEADAGACFDSQDGGADFLATSRFGCAVASRKPPPISGGTLIVSRGGDRAFAADPDRDAVYVVDIESRTVLFTIALQAGDEPGRLVEDSAGRVHVALRGSGTLATMDPTQGTVVSRRPVCPAPRGVGYDDAVDTLWVACETGELVALPAAGGAATRSLVIERDLRDVVVRGGAVAVSEFRSARVVHVTGDGTIASIDTMPAARDGFAPHVAWRAIASPSGSLLVAHQEESTTTFIAAQEPGAYAGGGGGSGVADPRLVGSVVTVLARAFPWPPAMSLELPDIVLPVDVAASRDGALGAVAGAANAFAPGVANVEVFTLDGRTQAPITLGANEQAIAVAFDGRGDLVVQTREPAALWILVDVLHRVGPWGPPIALSDASRSDTGHIVFHTIAGAPIACASCHPEGGDDGHVWMLEGQARRTQSLRGAIAGTAPYHWAGDKPGLRALVDDVYTRRMAGALLTDPELGALRAWVEAIPAPPAPSWIDSAAAHRGERLFARSDVGCSACHSGPKFTNNATLNVGTGGDFQVPPLVGVGWRTPLLHDGCALTIGDRFGACATPQHGSTASLSARELGDLSAYLESL